MSKESLDEDQLLADSDDSSPSDEVEVDHLKEQVGGVAEGFNRHQSDSESDSSDSDISDSDNVDDEEGQMEVDEDLLQAELTAVNDKLAEQPYSYDLYLDKIRILKSLGDLDLLRNVREKMSQLYPLSPSLWVDWIKDEQKMISTEEEQEYVVNLMDRAVKDYSSVEVWLEYINFRLSRVLEENGAQKCRDVFERALGNCGLHVSMGSLLWDTYRDFEAALLATAKTEEQQTEQEKRYVTLCKRQLAVPLLDMKSTYEQVESKIEIDENTDTAYNKALERLKDLENWEAKLVQASEDTQKLQVYNEYIEIEKKWKSNPARIQCLYERAVTDSPLSMSLWLEYIDYLSKQLKVPELVLDVAERASRNCPWILSIWTKYMWVVETFMGDEDAKMFEKMKTVFENAIVFCGTGDQAGTLWLKYLEFLRRRVDYNNPDAKKVEILRKTFTAAESHLLQLVQEPNDFISQILQFHARFESALAKSITEEVREIWRDIFQRQYGQTFRVWSQYISQEIRFGAEIKKIRGELSKAMSQVRDDPQSTADLWLNFERDYGDLLTLGNAESKIAKELEKSAYTNVLEQKYDHRDRSFQPKDAFGGGGNRKKRRFDERNSNMNYSDPVPSKKGKNVNKSIDDVDRGERAFKIPAIPVPKAKLTNSTNNREFKMDDVKANVPPGPKPFSAPAPVKHDPSKDNRTVFVSNLDFEVDEGSLKSFFTECGQVEEIRLVRDFKGRSKGFGYVVFNKSDSVKTSLEHDRKPLKNRPVFVSKCDPDKATRQQQFRYSTSLEKNKLFVKGLPFSMTDDELKKLFEEFGKLKDCRLVTHRNGHSKGIAYVEFDNAASASAAILKTDGTTIDDKVISVAISNPPSKNQPSQFSYPNFKSVPETSQRRGRNVFVPRALQVHPSASTGSQPEDSSLSSKMNSDSDTKPKPKSNDEFRRLFMKQ